MRLLVRVQEFCISEEFLMFISPAAPDFRAFLKTVTVPQVSDILVNFKLMSSVSGNLTITPAMLVALAEAKLLFTMAKEQLKTMKKCSKAAAKAFNEFSANLAVFSCSMGALEAQQVATCSGQWSSIYPREVSLEAHNPYSDAEIWAFEQLVEVETVLGTIAAREHLEQLKQKHSQTIENLNADLQSLKYSESTPSWMSRKPKFEKVAEAGDKLEQAEADLLSLEQLIEVVCHRIVQFEIPQAKRRLYVSYQQMMSIFAHGTLMQVSPLLQQAADIKNTLALLSTL